MLVLPESFDHIASCGEKWDVAAVQNDGILSVGGSYGRSGTNGLKVWTGGSAGSWAKIAKNVPYLATYVCGFAINVQRLDSTYSILSFFDGSTVQTDLRLRADGHFKFTRNGTDLGSPSSNALTFGNWRYVEALVTVSSGAGVCTLKVDGATWLSLVSQNTQATGSAQIGQVQFGGGNVFNLASEFWLDDIYINDTTGAYCNGFLGDVRVQASFPDGAGDDTDFTASAGANYAAVDEVSPNEDTDYVSSSTPGDKDTYTYGNLPSASGNVKAVVVHARTRKDDGGTRSIRGLAKSGTTLGEGSDLAVGTDYAYLSTVFHTNPDTGLPWAIAEVNAAKFGVKVSA
jgi:hypothetical protein